MKLRSRGVEVEEDEEEAAKTKYTRGREQLGELYDSLGSAAWVGGVRLPNMASGDYITVTELHPWIIPLFTA